MLSNVKGTLRSYLGEERYAHTRSTYHTLMDRTRSLFPRTGALPDFIIAGASKSGTTSLYHYLCLHPQVYPATDKEVHFFDRNYEKGETWYRRQFPTRLELHLNNAITGEATPYYLYHPLIPARIHRLVPEVKVIVLLRNPVDRTISDYWHAVNRGHEDLPLREALEKEDERIAEEEERLLSNPSYTSYTHRWHSYKGRSRYIDQIRRYTRLFEPDQLLILRSEDLFTRPRPTYDRITTFLDLEAFALPAQRAHNAGDYARGEETDIRSELEAYFEPYNEELYDLLEVRAPWW